jgi:glycosyltransferase involved in cell wall biosynthesis
MKVSVFTPLTANGNRFIQEAYDSLVAQSHTDWEWVVLENNGGRLPKRILKDKRVRLYGATARGVGALKLDACTRATGDALLELDHDDLLRPDTLELVAKAIEGGADFVYSDFAEFKTDTWEPNPYSSAFGWESYEAEWCGHALTAMRAPTDHLAWRRIEWAPNHLRAWRTSFYRQLPGFPYVGGQQVPFVGGHDASLEFADDHDLVMRSLLSGGKCEHIAKCLYYYRVHGSNNTSTRNARIQELESLVYDRYIYALAEHQARERGLSLIDLCGAHNSPGHYESWDLTLGHDLDKVWPALDGSVGVIRAFDAIEHLRDPIHTMNEAWRVLAPGGVMLVSVPSTEGRGAWCDPTHVSFWNDLSFRYYSDDQFRCYVPAIKARFQVARCRNLQGAIPYVQAELIALKDGYRPMGEVRC